MVFYVENPHCPVGVGLKEAPLVPEEVGKGEATMAFGKAPDRREALPPAGDDQDEVCAMGQNFCSDSRHQVKRRVCPKRGVRHPREQEGIG